MPRAPSELRFLSSARDDLRSIQDHNPDRAERILRKIYVWQEKIEWGRIPQEHLTYLTGTPAGYNFYRERIGNAGYRVVYEMSGDTMVVVAVLPKDDDAYDLDEYVRRLDRE